MKKTTCIISITALSVILISCRELNNNDVTDMYDVTDVDYNITATTEVLLTSESGEKLSRQDNISFKHGYSNGNLIVIRPDIVKQTIEGIGTSFTESSAFVLAHLDKSKRREVMNSIYAEDGANFTLARTPIGASDFSV